MDHLIDAVSKAIESSNWYAALFMSLALPDIAARIDDPNLTSQARYSAWVDKFLAPKYTTGGTILLSGKDCYALRCALLHEGRDTILEQSAREVIDQFRFVAPPKGWVVHRNRVNQKLQLQVEIFCCDICEAIKHWLTSIPANDTIRHERLSDLVTIQIGANILI